MTTYYVGSGGDDGNSGETWALRWEHLSVAGATATAGDVVEVGTGTYEAEDSDGAILVVDNAGTSTAPIVFRNGDDDPGTITLDAGTNSLDHCIIPNTFCRFEDFALTGAASHAVDGGSYDSCIFMNCSVYSNAGYGISGDDCWALVGCNVYSNVDYNVTLNEGAQVYWCKIHDVSVVDYNLDIEYGIILGCVFYGSNIGTRHIYLAQPPYGLCAVISCTIDGENIFGTIGIYIASITSEHNVVIVNNIIYDLYYGIYNQYGNYDGWRNTWNNLFNSNTTDVSNFTRGYQYVTGAPVFTDEAGHDYNIEQCDAIDHGGDLQRAIYYEYLIF